MHNDRDINDLSEIYAVIGRAVATLLENGQPPHVHNLMTMLQLHGAETSDDQQKALFLLARRLITDKMH